MKENPWLNPTTYRWEATDSNGNKIKGDFETIADAKTAIVAENNFIKDAKQRLKRFRQSRAKSLEDAAAATTPTKEG